MAPKSADLRWSNNRNYRPADLLEQPQPPEEEEPRIEIVPPAPEEEPEEPDRPVMRPQEQLRLNRRIVRLLKTLIISLMFYLHQLLNRYICE